MESVFGEVSPMHSGTMSPAVILGRIRAYEGDDYET